MEVCREASCAFVADDRAALVAHVLGVHLRHLCSVPSCVVSCKRLVDLRIHTRHVHQGQRYDCDGCGLSFSTVGTLNRHRILNCIAVVAASSVARPAVAALVVDSTAAAVVHDVTVVSPPVDDDDLRKLLDVVVPDTKEQWTQTEGNMFVSASFPICCFRPSI